MHNLTKTLLAGSFCTAFSATAVGQSIIEFNAEAPGSLPTVTPGDVLDEDVQSLSLAFDQETENFTFEATLAPNTNGTSVNSFSLLVGDSESLTGRTGEFALVYFDATRPGEPVVSVYAYNGASAATSFRFADFQQNAVDGSVAPDQIASSLNSSLSFLNSASVQLNDDGTQTFSVDIDASGINDHTPSVPSPNGADFFGLQVAQELGIWFHTFEQNFETAYTAEGFLVPETGNANLVETGFAVASNFDTLDLLNLTGTVVPEPASLLVVVGGLGLIAGRRRRA